MRNFLISLLSSILSVATYGTPLPENYRRELIEIGTQPCIDKQNQDPLSKAMGDSQIKEFCACTMSKAADLISLEEVNLMRQKKIQSVIGPAVAKGGQYCIKLLSEKWGYSTKDQGVHQNHAQQYPPTSSEKKELSSSLKKEIYDSSMWNCLKKQKADIENSIVPEEDIKEYCSCISKKYITIVTYDDITYMLKNKTYPSKLVKYIRQIGFDCASDIVKK